MQIKFSELQTWTILPKLKTLSKRHLQAELEALPDFSAIETHINDVKTRINTVRERLSQPQEKLAHCGKPHCPKCDQELPEKDASCGHCGSMDNKQAEEHPLETPAIAETIRFMGIDVDMLENVYRDNPSAINHLEEIENELSALEREIGISIEKPEHEKAETEHQEIIKEESYDPISDAVKALKGAGYKIISVSPWSLEVDASIILEHGIEIQVSSDTPTMFSVTYDSPTDPDAIVHIDAKDIPELLRVLGEEVKLLLEQDKTSAKRSKNPVDDLIQKALNGYQVNVMELGNAAKAGEAAFAKGEDVIAAVHAYLDSLIPLGKATKVASEDHKSESSIEEVDKESNFKTPRPTTPPPAGMRYVYDTDTGTWDLVTGTQVQTGTGY